MTCLLPFIISIIIYFFFILVPINKYYFVFAPRLWSPTESPLRNVRGDMVSSQRPLTLWARLCSSVRSRVPEAAPPTQPAKWILDRARISFPASTVQIRPGRRRRHIRRSSLDGADLLLRVLTRYETKEKEFARIWRASPIRTADLHTASDVTRVTCSSGTSRPSIESIYRATTVRCDPRVHPHDGTSNGGYRCLRRRTYAINT